MVTTEPRLRPAPVASPAASPVGDAEPALAVEALADGTLVRIAGALVVRTVADVRLVLHEAVDRGSGALVVDLAGVSVVDATGLGVLVGAHRRALRAERRLVLRHVPDRILRLLQLTRLHRVLAVEAPAAA